MQSSRLSVVLLLSYILCILLVSAVVYFNGSMGVGLIHVSAGNLLGATAAGAWYVTTGFVLYLVVLFIVGGPE